MRNVTETESIKSIIEDKAFLGKIIELSSVEEVKKAFKEKGLELSNKNIESIGEMVKYQIENPANVSEDTLEKITGGWSDPDFKKFKNISIGLSALLIGLSVSYATTSTVKNVNGHMVDFRDSWLWKIFTFRGQNTFAQ